MTQLLRLALSGPARGLRMIVGPLLVGSAQSPVDARAFQLAPARDQPSGEIARRRHVSAAQLDRLEL